jgi:uncharacterized protein (DUF2147 family)
MKKLLKVVVLACSLMIAPAIYAATSQSPVGLWQTIDDVSGKPKSILQITETSAHTLQGTVIKIYPRPGFDQNELCDACKGDKHNKRIVGMTILSGLKADSHNPGLWDGGEILDPHNGKTYHCTIQLTDNNQKLNVRGYIGMPLFGRSQIWQRVERS